MLELREDKAIYKVVMNLEEHYSIRPAERETPRGWTDVRPLSLRQHMERSGQSL